MRGILNEQARTPRQWPVGHELGNQLIRVSSKPHPAAFYWAGRPAMRVVQALHWMQDMLVNDEERVRVTAALHRIFADPSH